MPVEPICTERPCTYARFNPARRPRRKDDGTLDDKILLSGMLHGKYGNEYEIDDAGIVMGLARNGGADPVDGSVIIPSRAIEMENGRVKDVGIRTFPVERDGKAVDYIAEVLFGEFEPYGDLPLVALPYQQKKKLYVQCWTGDFNESEQKIVRSFSGLYKHGAVPYVGGTVLVEGGLGNKEREKIGDTNVNVLPKAAKIIGKDLVGRRINGQPLWMVRLMEIEFSKDDSEVVLVLHEGHLYLLMAWHGRPAFHLVTHEASRKKYMEAWLETSAKLETERHAQLPRPEAVTPDVLARESAAAQGQLPLAL